MFLAGTEGDREGTKLRKSFWFPGILQNESVELSGCEHVLSFKKREDLKGDSEVNRAATVATATTVPEVPGLRVQGGLLPRAEGVGYHTGGLTRQGCHPLAWKMEHGAKEDYSWALKSNGICLARFRSAWTYHLFSSFWFLPFGLGMFILCLSYSVFWKQITCLVSQVWS